MLVFLGPSTSLLVIGVCDAFIWGAISEAGNSNELILCSRGNSGSSSLVAVLMRASFSIVLDGFCDCTWRNFQSSWHFPYWLTFMSSSNDGLSFLFAYLSCSCHNMDLIFYQIGLYSVYHPYLVTTQRIGSNALMKEIPKYQGTPINLNAFQGITTWNWLRECQECAKLLSRQRVGTMKNIKNCHMCSLSSF